MKTEIWRINPVKARVEAVGHRTIAAAPGTTFVRLSLCGEEKVFAITDTGKRSFLSELPKSEDLLKVTSSLDTTGAIPSGVRAEIELVLEIQALLKVSEAKRTAQSDDRNKKRTLEIRFHGWLRATKNLFFGDL